MNMESSNRNEPVKCPICHGSGQQESKIPIQIGKDELDYDYDIGPCSCCDGYGHISQADHDEIDRAMESQSTSIMERANDNELPF